MMATSKYQVLFKILCVHENNFYKILFDFCSCWILVCSVRNNFKRENKSSVIFYGNELIAVSSPWLSGRNLCFGIRGHGFDSRVAGEIFFESPGVRCKPVINHQNYQTNLVTTPVVVLPKEPSSIPRRVIGLVPVVCSVWAFERVKPVILNEMQQ